MFVHFGATLTVVEDGIGRYILTEVMHPAIEIQLDDDLPNEFLIPGNSGGIGEIDDSGHARGRHFRSGINSEEGD